MNTAFLDLACELFGGCEALEEQNAGYWVPVIAMFLEDLKAHREADELERMAWMYSADIDMPRVAVTNRTLGCILGLWDEENWLSDEAPGWEWACSSYL